MSSSGNSPHPEARKADDAAKVAHELANLLDGSLRNVSLAMRRLTDTAQDPAQGGEVMPRLEAADEAMRRMISLVHNLRDKRPPARVGGSTMTLADAVGHAARLLKPALQRHHIDLQTNIGPDAAAMPGSDVYTIVVNAVHNSIDAFLEAGTPQPTVAINANLVDSDLHLQIHDNGPGLAPQLLDHHGLMCIGMTTKPDGHGIGMQLCHDIAARLLGTLSLRNRPNGGALLELTVPLKALTASEATESHD